MTTRRDAHPYATNAAIASVRARAHNQSGPILCRPASDRTATHPRLCCGTLYRVAVVIRQCSGPPRPCLGSHFRPGPTRVREREGEKENCDMRTCVSTRCTRWVRALNLSAPDVDRRTRCMRVRRLRVMINNLHASVHFGRGL